MWDIKRFSAAGDAGRWLYCDSAHRKRGACSRRDLDDAGLRGGVRKMSLLFRDEEFQAAWRELDEPQLEGGWELFTQAAGVRIHRRCRPVPKRHESAPLSLRNHRS